MKPELRYPTLEDFRKSECGVFGRAWEARKDRGFWPCLKCRGEGGYHKPEDRDCYEGYKMAPWYKCAACEGTGEGPKAKIVALYKEYMAKYRAELAAWKAKDRLRKAALKKLTTKEREALGLC